MAEEYATKTWPALAGQTNVSGAGGGGGGGGTGAIVMPHAALVAVTPSESLTPVVKLKFPAVDGVPVRAPVAALRVRPVGKVPEATEKV